MKVLVVTSPFGGQEVGRRIADEREIADILAGEHANKVVAADHPIETTSEE